MSGQSASSGWFACAGVLGAGAVVSLLLPATALDWQPGLALAEPWRWWTAAFVHWSRWHLVANLAGLALVALLGGMAGLQARSAMAWFVAWPLTQLALLARPALAHFGGLSGVLHAGVVIAAWHLVRHGAGSRRWIGLALLAGTAAKLLLEAPWGPELRRPADWDIPIAPLAHTTGALAGLLCAWLADRAAFLIRPR